MYVRNGAIGHVMSFFVIVYLMMFFYGALESNYCRYMFKYIVTI